MWRRASLSLLRSSSLLRRPAGAGADLIPACRALSSIGAFRGSPPLFSSDSGAGTVKKSLEDALPIATGLEREEVEAELEGKKRFDMDAPVGPFGTKEAPAVIESYYNKRIVGCPGGEGEDEHDVIWFWLEKDKPHECPVCSQYFTLKVIGEGGDPDGHGDSDDEDEHHH